MYVFTPGKDDEEQRRRSRDHGDGEGDTPRGCDVGLTTGQEGSSQA